MSNLSSLSVDEGESLLEGLGFMRLDVSKNYKEPRFIFDKFQVALPCVDRPWWVVYRMESKDTVEWFVDFEEPIPISAFLGFITELISGTADG